MNQDLMHTLEQITGEEQEILDGRTQVRKTLYTAGSDFTIDSRKMLEKGRLIDVRTHTRFIDFPRHKHNYIEIMYMCRGRTTHIINNGDRVTLETGDLLFMNQHCSHEVLPAGKDDIGINFIILPEFFDVAFDMMEEENVLSNFIISTLMRDSSQSQYLHFHVSDVLPVQNLVENMVWSLENRQLNGQKIAQTTMGLLFLQLLNYTDRIEQGKADRYASRLAMAALRYIEENYKEASLTELARRENQSVYELSRLIKAQTGFTFKELLQLKRFNKAASLLAETRLPVTDIIEAVGYDNTSYFYRRFSQKYGMSPKKYRAAHSGASPSQ